MTKIPHETRIVFVGSVESGYLSIQCEKCRQLCFGAMGDILKLLEPQLPEILRIITWQHSFDGCQQESKRKEP